MRKLLAFFLTPIYLFAAGSFSFEPTAKMEPYTLKDSKQWCHGSGENLLQTYITNYIARLSDGMDRQYASIRFLHKDFDAIRDRVVVLKVVDSASGEFIPVEDAYFVVNSSLSSPHSKYAKIAFANTEDAKEFIQNYGGDIRDFDFTFYMAGRDKDLDAQHYKARDMRAMQRGQRIYERMCSDIEPLNYHSIHNLKTAIKSQNLCGTLSETNLQNLSNYLWNMKRLDMDALQDQERIEVPEDAKCPVCGMYVARYPKWVGKITFDDGHAHYFDGAKDLFKYYFDPQDFIGNHTQDSFEKIKVTNYYTLQPIVAQDAYYVIGSNVYGPMGHELIPFTTKKEAKNFKSSHFGEKIITFDEITKEEVYALDHR